MRIFRDSVNPAAIPLGGIQGVIGYCNGAFRWTAHDTARFTKAGLQVAHIDVNGTAWEEASIVDVETGDLGPAQAPDWIRKRHAFRGDAVALLRPEHAARLARGYVAADGAVAAVARRLDRASAHPGAQPAGRRDAPRCPVREPRDL